ncbi:hypothetical protein M8494_20005 [Serratia ureilytica]
MAAMLGAATGGATARGSRRQNRRAECRRHAGGRMRDVAGGKLSLPVDSEHRAAPCWWPTAIASSTWR